MKHFKTISILIFSLILIACSISPFSKRSAASCPKKKSRKVRTYRLKKTKKSNRNYAYSGGSKSSSSSSNKKAAKITPKPAKKQREQVQVSVKENIDKKTTENVKQKQTKKEEEQKIEKPLSAEKQMPTIADMKVGKNEVRLKGKKIDLDKKAFRFDENIEFKDRSDSVVNQSKVQSQMRELIKFLKDNKDVKVTIIGNAASTTPIGGVIYGDSDEALNQEAILGKDTVQIREVMTARARVIYKLLQTKGIPSSQMDYKTGSYRKWKKQRVVSFILRKKED